MRLAGIPKHPMAAAFAKGVVLQILASLQSMALNAPNEGTVLR
jgi:hypothetical protein